MFFGSAPRPPPLPPAPPPEPPIEPDFDNIARIEAERERRRRGLKSLRINPQRRDTNSTGLSIKR